jgi:hypothetical protein
VKRAALTLLIAVSTCPPAAAQDFDGYVSVLLAAMPDVGRPDGQQSVTELRSRLFAEGLFDVGDSLHLTLGAFVDGLVADREATGGMSATTGVIVRPADFYLQVRTDGFDLRVGMARIVWGRLDELQPSDVVNPIDVSRFFLEGRSEARLPVGLVRARVFLPADTTLETIVVPWFRRGRFDQLEERDSPFNLRPALPTMRVEPATSWRNVQGGARVTTTLGRVDVGGSVYRGFEPFPLFTAGADIVETFPRFTMIAGDFESVTGPWGVRGEAAFFVNDTHQSLAPVAAVRGRSVEGGVGVDRSVGSYRVSGNVLISRRTVDEPIWQAVENTDVTLIAWAERTFARDTRAVRLLGLYNPEIESAFVRLVAAFSLRDNVWLETSAGWLDGSGADTVSALATRDFLYARLKFHF